MQPMLNTAVKAARQAGNIILHHFDRGDSIDVREKATNDFVTAVDQAAEQAIIETLSNAYPDHAILAEESGDHAGSDYQWIIDPLDGTTNFMHGLPHCAVSIAVRHKNKLVHGVIYDPLRNELFTATAGSGSRLDNRRIRVSKTQRLQHSLLATGFPFKTMEHLDDWLSTLKHLLPRTRGVRRAGSAALDLAYVACGRFDGFWEAGLSPWDIAAGWLLVQEAGGIVTDYNQGQESFTNGSIIAANPQIHPLISNIVMKK